MYLGLDLAWSPNNLTGACAINDEGCVVDERMLGPDDDIIDWITSHLADQAVVAIDAPLQVPNDTGRRPCESKLHREYGSRRAGPHPSNRSLLLATHGTIRGEVLAARLVELGFGGPWAGSDRTVLEVYPHPTIIETFGLPERLLYKAKRGVSVDRRRQGLRTLAQLIDSLAHVSPPLLAPAITISDAVRGGALKAVEDRLDARLCAWVASVWGRSPDRIRLFGDPDTGHIAVPVGQPPTSGNPGDSESVIHRNFPGEPMQFGITFDYLCPFARNAAEAVLNGLEEGRHWQPRYVAFSLAQVHTAEDEPAVWDRPSGKSGVLALQWGIATRDHFPEVFPAVHRALFAARHDQGRDINSEAVIREAVSATGADADAIAAVVATGTPLEALAADHAAAVNRWSVFGVPTFLVDEEAAFVRFMNRGDIEDLDRVLDMLTWSNLNEFKRTTIPR